MTDEPMDAVLKALQESWMAEAKDQAPRGAASRCLIDYPFHVFSRGSLWCQCGQRHIDGDQA